MCPLFLTKTQAHSPPAGPAAFRLALARGSTCDRRKARYDPQYSRREGLASANDGNHKAEGRIHPLRQNPRLVRF